MVVGKEVWADVAEVVERVFKRVTYEVLDRKLEEPSLFVNALLGKINVINSKAERLVVTLIGESGPDIVKPFFDVVEELPPPFHFLGVLKRNGWELAVKVVSGPRAFNSTMKKSVAEASYLYDRPVILTLQGSFGREHTKLVGKAIWYDGVATWFLLSGDRYAYRKFKDLVYDIARPYRAMLISKIMSEVDRFRSKLGRASS